MRKLFNVILSAVFSVYIGYLLAGVVSVYLNPNTAYFIGDTIAYGVVPAVLVGVPVALLVFILSLWTTPKSLSAKYLVPSLISIVCAVGVWLDTNRPLTEGHFWVLYIGLGILFIFVIVYSYSVKWLTA
jgi:hypothetical protein